jgi:hypothetical protein
MTETIDENAAVKEIAKALEAEGLEASDNPFPPGVPVDPCTQQREGWGEADKGRVERVDEPTREWMLSQAPAPLPYLRELVQLARESGMTFIRTGNLEIKFDPDHRKPEQQGERQSF